MHLTPEQRETGKQNFNEATGATRREFLQGTIAAGAVTSGALGAMYFGYGQSVDKPLRVGIIGTGDEGSVLIGALNPDYVQVTAIADIRPYNIHRAFHGDQGNLSARPGLMSIYKWNTEDAAKKIVDVYDGTNESKGTYKEMLEDPDIEGVIIALPLWLHHPVAIEAMRAGKHVLTEKLMGQTIAQCKEMARVSEAEEKILATGHQRHYSILYANAVDQIKQGLLGDLHHIRAQWHRNNLPGGDSWTPPMPSKILPEKEYLDLRREVRGEKGKPAEATLREEYKILEKLHSLEKDLAKKKAASRPDTKAIEKREAQIAETKARLADYAVDAAKYGYESKTLPGGYTYSPLEELIRWRLWNRTGAGLMAELGSHQLDAASIFVSSQRDDGEKVYPLSVQGFGMRSLFPANREVDDHVHCNFEFPMKGYFEDITAEDPVVADDTRRLAVTYSSINGNGFGDYGEVVFGTKGTLILDKEKEALLFKRGDANSKIEVKEGSDGPALDSYETGGGAAIAEVATPKDISRGYREEIEHWAWCIRNPDPENQPKCKPKVAMADAIIALTSNIAMSKGERIEFNKLWFDIESDETPEADHIDGPKPKQAKDVKTA